MKTIAPLLTVLFLCAAAFAKEDRERSFDSNWRFLRSDAPGADSPDFADAGWRVLDVPHDWSIEDLPDAPGRVGPFDPKTSEGGIATGHVLGGVGWYRKHFTLNATETNKVVLLRFDGVYMDADVWLNGEHLGDHPYGYTPFSFDLTTHLKPGENVLSVRVQNLGKNSRWYSGSGIFRHVWLTVTDPVRVPLWGIRVITPHVTKQTATVNVTTTVENGLDKEAQVILRTRLVGPDGKALKAMETPIRVLPNKRQENTQIFSVPAPRLWSLDTPALYRAEVEIVAGKTTIDHAAAPFGIRSIRFNSKEGFVLNEQGIKLKGACLHHDNGPLGSAAIDRAEERRVEVMKANGFNAIRTSHNPPSPAFLDACDRLGMLVIDEAFDTWENGKNPEDYHRFFKDWSKRDLESMVLRDRNHPSVILWSVGNEIPERADVAGVATCERLAQTIRHLDTSRPVTEAICAFWDHPGRQWSATAPGFVPLGVGGYNYEWRQYEPDHKTFPMRVMVGTESYPKEALENWQAVQKNSWVIGDFVWTGMDYLGESGIGHSVLDNEKNDFSMPFPWFNAWCGDIDICGFKKPQMYYRDVVWGNTNIALAVHVPLAPGRAEKVSGWGWPDEVQSWTWPGQEGKKMKVAVYSSCEAVCLELNGKVIEVKPVSIDTKLTARFEVPYAPGQLRAVGLIHGKPVGSAALFSAGAPQKLRLTADRAKIRADRNDLSYVTVEVIDSTGKVVPSAALPVRFSVSGPGELAAVGSANPSDAASFRAPIRTTFRGRCLAILRPKGEAGKMTLRAEADGLSSATIAIKIGK